jgi:hypothetical protein
MTHPRRLAIAVLSMSTLACQSFAAQTRANSAPDGTSLDDLRITARLDEIRQQRDAYEASQLVARAVKEVRAGRDSAAEPLFAKAVQLDNSN